MGEEGVGLSSGLPGEGGLKQRVAAVDQATGVILNPKAGGIPETDFRQPVRRWANTYSVPLRIHVTDGTEDLQPVVEEMQGWGAERILVAGGDGTVARAATALLGRGIPMGLLPIGTANGVARELGIPLSIENALGMFDNGHRIRDLDVIYCEERAFLISLSVGVSANSMGGTDREDKQRYGLFAYFLNGARQVLEIVPQSFSLGLDGEWIHDAFIEVAILNMGITGIPEALLGGRIDPDDGQLRLLTMGRGSIPERAIQSITGKSNGLESWIQSRDIQQVEIHGDSSLIVQGDGDIIGNLPVRVEVLPKAIQVFVPDK